MLTPKHYVNFALAFVLVLCLWGAVFFLPYILSDVDKIGVFGDSFGSVNALFSGLGFAALTVTILLQLYSLQGQRTQEKFTTALKIVSDVREDLNNLVIGNSTGVNAITVIITFATLKPATLAGPPYAETITILTCAIAQLLSLKRYCDKHLKDEEADIVNDKISTLYLSYLIRLRNALRPHHFENREIDLLKVEIENLGSLIAIPA